MSSNTPSGHCSGTNIRSKRTPGRLAHRRLASTSGVGAASIATTESQREASERVKTPIEHPTSRRRSITRLPHRVQSERVFGSLVWTRREVPRIRISRIERVEILGLERLARVRSCVAFKKEFIWEIETSQAALGESKSVRIVVDKIACLRPVCGNGAPLLFKSLMIKADPVSATDRINFGRGRKRMAPDDVFEQSEFAVRDAEPDARSDRTPHGRNADRAAS